MRRRRISIVKRRRRARLIRVFSVASVVFVLLLGLGIYGMWQQVVRITNIEIAGTRKVEPTALVDTIHANISGTRFIIPRDSIFFFPRRAVIRAVKERFPRIRTLQLQRAGFSKLKVSVTERTPKLEWCGEAQGDTQNCFLVDETGFLFAPSIKKASTTTLYGKLTAPGPLKSFFYAPQAVPRTLPLLTALEDTGLHVASLTFREDDEVAMTLDEGIVVTYVLGEEEFIAQALPQLLASGDIRTIDTIDMRFGKRVYIKRRE